MSRGMGLQPTLYLPSPPHLLYSFRHQLLFFPSSYLYHHLPLLSVRHPPHGLPQLPPTFPIPILHPGHLHPILLRFHLILSFFSSLSFFYLFVFPLLSIFFGSFLHLHLLKGGSMGGGGCDPCPCTPSL